MESGFHPYAWTLWLAAGMIAVLVTRNPLYLSILLLAAAFLYAILLRRAKKQQADATHSQPLAWQAILYLALSMWGFSILFNALTVHVGDHVLFALPDSWPVIGGPITLESIVYGFVTGLSFVSLILIFAIYNSVLGPQTILRLIPGFAYQTGVAVSIAISFIPQTVIAWSEIREAQRLRGHKVKGLRDTLPLFVSLLGYGLDRAIQLAESMDARGFGGRLLPATPRETWIIRGSAITGLALLLIGLIVRSYYPEASWAGLGLLAAGMLLMGFSLWRGGRRVKRSRYRRWLWRPRDTLLTASAGLLLAGALLLSWLSPDTLFYYPYPPYDFLPAFNPFLGLLYALPLLPALLLPPPEKR
jgi:energy-coupling factor transport system permease protein